MLQSKGIKADSIGDRCAQCQKLAAGRIDLWATGLHRGKWIAAEANISTINPLLLLKDVDHFLACYPSSDGAHTGTQRAVETMRRDGVIHKISDQYQERR